MGMVDGTVKIPSWLRILLGSSPVVLGASAVRLLLVANGDPVAATKIAATSGVTGTLLGTLIPLLPPFLPLAVVALVLARRWELAALAVGAMVLVSPARTGWAAGWWGIEQLLGRAIYWGHRLATEVGDGSKVSVDLRYVHGALVRHRWPPWVFDIACCAAIASAPKSLRPTPKDDLKKKIDEHLKEFEENSTVVEFKDWRYTGRRWAYRIRLIQLPHKYEEGQLYRKWRIQKRNELRLSERKKAQRDQWRRLGYGVLIGLLAVPAVGLVMRFYAVPITGVDAGPLIRSVWLPAEAIAIRGQPQPTVGYVLSTSDKWFVVLTEPHRTIAYISSDAVTARSVCSLAREDDTHRGAPLVRLHGAEDTRSPVCAG
jgi:hypothetical protein